MKLNKEQIYKMSTLTQLRDASHQIAVEHGFWEGKVVNEAEKMALMHSELSEALEALRKGDYKNLAEELADTIIRVLDFCGAKKIDILTAIQDKMIINNDREYKHGKKF